MAKLGDLIKTKEDLINNLNQIEVYLKNFESAEEMKNYIRRGKNFVMYKFVNEYHFAPSRFVGYLNNTLIKHNKNESKHGWKTYGCITQILSQQCRYDDRCEKLFIQYCSDLSIVPYNKKRMYWVMDEDFMNFEEGKLSQILKDEYERNPEARKKCIEAYGAICKVCGFDFKNFYGELGEGYIHVHHIIPLSQIKNSHIVNYVEDLIPVCPNCHAMLHKGNLSVEELQKIIHNNKK